jgi:hypothetical protein
MDAAGDAISVESESALRILRSYSFSDPVADADDLADVPETQGPVVSCPGTR